MEGRIPGQDGVASTQRPTMTRARFSIGIDLGTTNCALAFVPLHGEARSEILGIPQWDIAVRNNGIRSASIISLPAGGSGRCPNPGRGGR